MATVKHVVVDSGGFIRNSPVKDIGENIYTVRDVVNEIRDKTTRQRLQVLPYELKFREPSSEAIQTVTEFAKRTGDYRSLSAVDIRVIALVYQLEKEFVGTKHIKTIPDRNISWQITKKNLENPTEIAGFYLDTKVENSRTSSVCEGEKCPSTIEEIKEAVRDLDLQKNQISDSKGTREETLASTNKSNDSNLESFVESSHSAEYVNCTEGASVNKDTVDIEIRNDSVVEDNDKSGEARTQETKGVVIGEGDVLPSDCLETVESDDNDNVSDEESDEDTDDDEEGWITPSNIKQMKAMMGDKNVEKANVSVGCITTDFSMQNVLLQMGLNVISVDGLLIRRAKNYVLRCYACFKISTDMTREFCHHCGNKTLQRVSMTVEEDGSIKYFLSAKKPISLRGTKFSLPMPKGGKHAQNPILVEDQKEAHQRGSKHSKVKYDVMDPDYVFHTSPFAPTDIHSRAGLMGIRGNRGKKKSRNPNENRKVYGRRK